MQTRLYNQQLTINENTEIIYKPGQSKTPMKGIFFQKLALKDTFSKDRKRF